MTTDNSGVFDTYTGETVEPKTTDEVIEKLAEYLQAAIDLRSYPDIIEISAKIQKNAMRALAKERGFVETLDNVFVPKNENGVLSGKPLFLPDWIKPHRPDF